MIDYSLDARRKAKPRTPATKQLMKTLNSMPAEVCRQYLEAIIRESKP